MELSNSAFPGHSRQVGNCWCFGREKLLFIELRDFPWWVPQNKIEAAVLHDFGEREVPVVEPMATLQFARKLMDAAALRQVTGQPVQVLGVGNGLQGCPRLWRKVRAHEQVGAQRFPGARRVLSARLPCGALALDLIERVLRHCVEIEARHGHLQNGVPVEQAVLIGLAVAFLEIPAHRLVVAGQRLVGIAGNAVRHDLRIEYAHQAVALEDVGVEEGERFAGLHRLHPERRLAKLDGKRIAVHPVDAMLHYLAQRMLPRGLVGGVGVRLDAGDFTRETAGRRQQEVPRSTGRIDDPQVQNGAARILRAGGQGLRDDRIERGPNQLAHQGRRRVVGAGQLALGSLRFVSAAVAGEGEGPRRGVHVDDGPKLQEALVDGPQFLGVHVAVVDAGERVAGAEEREGADRFEQVFVGDGGAVEVGAFAAAEETAQGGQAEIRNAVGERSERDCEPLPQIGVAVVMAAAQCPFAQAGQGIPFRINGALRVRCRRRVKQIAFLGGEEEKQAVNEPE